jgi:tetratricopeptide (TPR) repeat protein
MYKSSRYLLLVIILLVSASLWCQKSTERLAREKGVEAEELWESEDYASSASAAAEAIALFKKAVEEDGIPGDDSLISHWLYIAFDCYVKSSDLAAALEILEDIIMLDTGNMKLYEQKAIIQKKLDRYDDAIETYTYIDSLKPSASICNKLAEIYQDREDWENALLWYSKSYAIRQDSKTINNIAVINLTLGRNEEAINAYKDYIATDPPAAAKIRTYKNMGKLYEDIGQIANSLEYYEKSNELRFDSQLTLLLISRYYDLGRLDKSLEKIELYLKDKPDGADALYYRALIKYDRGDLPGARQDFEKINTNPTYGSIAQGYIESIDSQ